MKTIPLTQGQSALVDDDDYEELSKHKWYAHMSHGHYYAIRNSLRQNGKRTAVKMHRQIINVPDGMATDHINGDGLDNRKCNLRICNPQQNNTNSKKRTNSTSVYKGVFKVKGCNRWAAKARREYLGLFKSEKEAAKAYDVKAKELFGEYARLNFGGNDNG
jgi:hypothetical protein